MTTAGWFRVTVITVVAVWILFLAIQLAAEGAFA